MLCLNHIPFCPGCRSSSNESSCSACSCCSRTCCTNKGTSTSTSTSTSSSTSSNTTSSCSSNEFSRRMAGRGRHRCPGNALAEGLSVKAAPAVGTLPRRPHAPSRSKCLSTHPTHDCTLALLLLPLVIFFAYTNQLMQAYGQGLAGARPIRVTNDTQLRFAMTIGRPILIVDSFYILQPLPNVTTSITISGDATSCRKKKWGVCRLDCRRRFRHFEVVKGGVLIINSLSLTRGRTRDGESGGSIYVRNGGVLRITGVTFRYNSALGTTSGGGAIEVETGGVVRATNCGFIRNSAGFGGAVAGAKSASILVTQSFFHRNIASTAGGALSLILQAAATLANNDFTSNQAAIGGAIQLFSARMSICYSLPFNGTATLAGPSIIATNSSVVYTCGVPNSYIVLLSGSTLTKSCALCPPGTQATLPAPNAATEDP